MSSVQAPSCWINTVSRAHVRAAVEGGFTQADHGRNARLKRLRRGDRLAFYSPRTEFRGGVPLQAFTAIGTVTDDEPYQVEVSPDFHPWRRRVDFEATQEAPIRPLLERLSFTPDSSHWGVVFRRGLFEVPCEDVELIASAMRV